MRIYHLSAGVLGIQNKASDPLVLESQTVVNYHVLSEDDLVSSVSPESIFLTFLKVVFISLIYTVLMVLIIISNENLKRDK